uniref:NADH dehydrogenase [ubiquinone] 1 alpha subcomplex assembly factor 4 n=1 Tax=Rhodnius prolixus TaxID=13249 RepID=T1HXS9_RHOPR
MGKALSILNRQINRFNAENRAHRVISKDKPAPAPKHPSTQKQIDEFLSETQEIRNELMSKNHQLDENLKKVYVVSHTTADQRVFRDRKLFMGKAVKSLSVAKLPKSRSRVVDSEFGYQEPEIIPEGKITLKQVMNILVQHQEDGKKYNASYFSSQYKLTEEDAVNLLKYFSPFKVHIPEK